MTCENPQLLLDGLKRAGLVSSSFSLSLIIQETLAGDNSAEGDFLAELETIQTGDKRAKLVSFLKWEKVKQQVDTRSHEAIRRVPMTAKAESLTQQMRQDYVSLKEHVLRDITIKRYLKELRT